MDTRSFGIAGLLLLLLIAGVVVYQFAQSDSQAANALTVSFVPSENNEAMADDFEPMRLYLEKTLNRPVKVLLSADYNAAIEAMKKGDVDVVRFGPLSYVLAEQACDAEVFAVEIRADGERSYNSIFLVPADSPAQSIEDLAGKRVAFVDPASTSGRLMPTHLVLRATGKLPEQFFGELRYLGSHDAVQRAVQQKSVDAGASNTITYEKLTRQGVLGADDVRVLVKSEPLPGIPIVWNKNLDPAYRRQIRDAFLNAHQEIEVSALGKSQRYDAATPAEYDIIRDLVKKLNLKREEVLE